MNPNDGLVEALRSALEHHADRVAIVLEARTTRAVTYRRLAEMVELLRPQLRRLGIGPGQIVPMCVAKTPEAVALALASLFEGAAFCWLNERYRARHLREIAAQTSSAGLVFDASSAALASELAESDAHLVPPILLGGQDDAEDARRREERAPSLTHLSPAPPKTTAGWPPARACSDGAACVLFTSGSTGAPKGVLIGGGDLLARARTEIACFGLGPGQALLGVLPLSFDVGLNQLVSSLLSGATLHLAQKWLRADLTTVVRRACIAGISATPGIWSACLQWLEPGASLFGSTPSLRYVTVSGGSLPVPLFERLCEALDPHVAVHKTYGQTETFRSTMFLHANAPSHAKRGGVGYAVAGTKLFVARDRERLALPGEIGELLHAGDGTMMGYLADQESTRAKLATHPALGAMPVIYTGDLGSCDADGFVRLVGRRDGMIKVFGVRFYPTEIEEVLAQHPDVVESVAFGLPDPVFGETVAAVVVGRVGIDVRALRTFASRQMPSYMVPRSIAVWPELPRTPNGKPALAEIKQRFALESR